MKNIVVACVILLFASSRFSAQIIVQTPNGKLQGAVENGFASFKGVPFAQPPVGDLRFKPPLSPKSWSGIRKADTFSAGCTVLHDAEIAVVLAVLLAIRSPQKHRSSRMPEIQSDEKGVGLHSPCFLKSALQLRHFHTRQAEISPELRKSG